MKRSCKSQPISETLHARSCHQWTRSRNGHHDVTSLWRMNYERRDSGILVAQYQHQTTGQHFRRKRAVPSYCRRVIEVVTVRDDSRVGAPRRRICRCRFPPLQPPLLHVYTLRSFFCIKQPYTDFETTICDIGNVFYQLVIAERQPVTIR